MICDYFIIRRKRLVVDDLYLRDGQYEYSAALTGGHRALVIGSAIALWTGDSLGAVSI